MNHQEYERAQKMEQELHDSTLDEAAARAALLSAQMKASLAGAFLRAGVGVLALVLAAKVVFS